MRLTLDLLRTWVDLPSDVRASRLLLDDVGLEVKRLDPSSPGVPLTLELLANRGDHRSLDGLAREVSGRTGGTIRRPETLALAAGGSPHPVVVETPLAPVYALTPLRRARGGSLDPRALADLAAVGLRSVHPVVDATNLALAELGQPTHAFDADTIVGAVRVRPARAGETAHLLFEEAPRAVPEGAVVIADDVKILAIAGVIGCEESKTTERTTRVLLESAAFDPVAVRKAARALGVSTDSSGRFERGADFAAVLHGAGRVARLLADAGWEIEGPSGVVSTWSDPGRVVPFDPAACRRFLGIDEDDATLLARLARYGFVAVPGGVRVPTWRLWDVEHDADLYEEIAKSIGYDATPIGLPPVDMGALPTPVEHAVSRVSEVLVGAGFYEVVTDGFHGRELDERLGFGPGHPLADHVHTLNALDAGYSLLKTQALGQALEGVAESLRRKHDEIKAFEWTRTFHPDASAANGVCVERRILWAIASGGERPRSWAGPSRSADALWLKGLVAEIASEIRLPLDVGPHDPSDRLGEALHPGRRASIRRDGRVVGVLGEVHPAVLAAYRIKRARPVFLQIALDALLGDPAPFAFSEPPRVPPVPRSLAFTLPLGVEAGEVLDVLRGAGGSRLAHAAVVDRYDHEEDGRPVRTLTFDLAWANDEADATGEAINAATEALVAAVAGRLGPRGVRLRA